MIFTAFDAVVGRVDDFNKMTACWRKALTVIEQEIRKLSYIIEQHPNTEVLSAISRPSSPTTRSGVKNAAVGTAIPISGKSK